MVYLKFEVEVFLANGCEFLNNVKKEPAVYLQEAHTSSIALAPILLCRSPVTTLVAVLLATSDLRLRD